MKMTSIGKLAMTTAGAAFAASMIVSGPVAAEGNKGKEKCYGVVAKGANDCGTASHSCAGQAKEDHAKDEWIYVPAGLCERLAGGSTEAPKA